MKRYLLFQGDDYYPLGGAKDFCSSYDTLEAAKAEGEHLIGAKPEWRWYHVVDANTMLIVHNSDKREQEDG